MSFGEVAAFYKPLFFEFPDEIGAYANQELNIMLGSALKLSVLSNELGKDSADFYFGVGYWCNVYNTNLGTESCFNANAAGKQGITKTLSTLAYDFHVHLRSGHIIPYQDATALHANTTADLQKQPVEFHIHGKPYSADFSSWNATGAYLNDDGVVLDLLGK